MKTLIRRVLTSSVLALPASGILPTAAEAGRYLNHNEALLRG
jgi:hypothetical protein